MFNTLQDPANSAAFLEANPQCKIEGGNTRAFMYHWIHTLKSLGLNDASITADHPLVAVFNRNGQRTYAAYNAETAPLNVTFSDSFKLTAKPKALTVMTR
jgi:hypothetical protein